MALLRVILGSVFLVLGVLGLFLPVLQGVLFLLIGLALLFPKNQHLQKLLQRARQRYPEQAARLKRLQDAWGKRRRRRRQ